MAIEITVETPILKGEKGDKGDTGSFDYTHLEEIVDEHLDNRFADVDASLDLKVDKEVGKSLVDDEYIEKLNNLETLDKTVVEKFNDKVEQKDFEENVIQMKSELQNYINQNLEESNGSDMRRDTYDSNYDGIVNRADRAGNADNADKVNNLTVETAVPVGAVFTDTTYEAVTTEKDGLMSFSDKLKLNGIESGANFTQIIDSLESEETLKALSANQGKVLNENITNIDNKLTDYINQEPVILFEGAIPPKENQVITLSESMKKFKNLVFLINSDPAGIGFGFGIYPVVDQSKIPKFAGQSLLFCDAIPHEDNNVNSISIYSGEFKNISQTQIQTIVPIHNILLRQGLPIGGATEYYVRQIWGLI